MFEFLIITTLISAIAGAACGCSHMNQHDDHGAVCITEIWRRDVVKQRHGQACLLSVLLSAKRSPLASPIVRACSKRFSNNGERR